MQVVKTPNEHGKPKEVNTYRIVQYPDGTHSDPYRKVFFVDKKVKKKLLFIFPYTVWETQKWSDGTSMYWHDLTKCQNDVGRLKRGEKIYK